MVPSGVAAVLAVLRSSAVVLDPSDAVRAGLARGARLRPGARPAPGARGAARDRPAGAQGRRDPGGRDRAAARPAGHRHARRVRPGRPARRRSWCWCSSRTTPRPAGSTRSAATSSPTSATSSRPRSARCRCWPRRCSGASDDPEAVRRFAGRMQHEAHRLTNLVQDLIDLSRVQGDDPLAAAVPVDLDEVVGAARERVAEAAEARTIEIVMAGADGVPVLGDLGQLVTAVRNLVDNAVNYSPDGTKVVVSVRVEGELVEIIGHRPGHRHPRPGPQPDLRALLPRRPGALADHRRHRPRPVDRQARRRHPRRRGVGLERRGRGLHLHPPAAGGRARPGGRA